MTVGVVDRWEQQGLPAGVDVFVKVVFDGGYQMWRDTYVAHSRIAFRCRHLEAFAHPNDSPPHPRNLAVQVDVFAA
ncbi:Uncharacterised protein [Mycobacterium tuberculosis]|nr:Uncharacterised protein [Mycobacterium tuberculosis]